MAVRAKFRCVTNERGKVVLEVVTSGSEENEKFWEYTPAGQIFMFVDNEEAIKQFQEGKEYYVDFTQVGDINA